MIKKVKIIEKGFKGTISEYLIVLNENATDEDYYDLAWEFAIDELIVNPTRKNDYEFEISDYSP